MRTASRFAEFWDAYPTKRGKAEAEKAYAKQIKAGATHEQIMQGLACYVRLLAAPGAPSPKYAQGWLNGKRWEDEDRPGGLSVVNGSEEIPWFRR